MDYAFIIAYRARSPQTFRSIELEGLIDNIRSLSKLNTDHTFRVFVIEQDDDLKFNRGFLLNAGFIEAHKINANYCFVHCNTDYRIPIAPLPDIFCTMPNGFLDLHGFPLQLGQHVQALGGFASFSASAYLTCNGFPNDLWGWGGDDWAIWLRTKITGVAIIKPANLYNKWVIEKHNHVRDRSDDDRNIQNALNTTFYSLAFNGVSTCKYYLNESWNDDFVSWRKVVQFHRQ